MKKMELVVHTSVCALAATPILAMLLCVTSSAQDKGAAPACPNLGVKEEERPVATGPYITCGTGLGIEVGGLTLRPQEGRCPSFVVYYPLKYTKIKKRGFFVQQIGTNSSVMVFYDCNTRWLLGFLPIPIGSHCQRSKSKFVGHYPLYDDKPCAMAGLQGEE